MALPPAHLLAPSGSPLTSTSPAILLVGSVHGNLPQLYRTLEAALNKNPGPARPQLVFCVGAFTSNTMEMEFPEEMGGEEVDFTKLGVRVYFVDNGPAAQDLIDAGEEELLPGLTFLGHSGVVRLEVSSSSSWGGAGGSASGVPGASSSSSVGMWGGGGGSRRTVSVGFLSGKAGKAAGKSKSAGCAVPQDLEQDEELFCDGFYSDTAIRRLAEEIELETEPLDFFLVCETPGQVITSNKDLLDFVAQNEAYDHARSTSKKAVGAGPGASPTGAPSSVTTATCRSVVKRVGAVPKTSLPSTTEASSIALEKLLKSCPVRNVVGPFGKAGECWVTRPAWQNGGRAGEGMIPADLLTRFFAPGDVVVGEKSLPEGPPGEAEGPTTTTASAAPTTNGSSSPKPSGSGAARPVVGPAPPPASSKTTAPSPAQIQEACHHIVELPSSPPVGANDSSVAPNEQTSTPTPDVFGPELSWDEKEKWRRVEEKKRQQRLVQQAEQRGVLAQGGAGTTNDSNNNCYV